MSGVLFSSAAGPIATITNYYSAGSVSSSSSIAANEINNLKETLSGALTATTPKQVLTRTGRGRINALTDYTKDTTSRTVRIRLIVDGQATPAFDATSNSITTSGAGMVVLGAFEGSTPSSQVWQPCDYNASVEVWIASSLSETDKVAIGINEEVWQ